MADVQYWRLTDRQLRNILLEHPSIGIQLSQNSGGLLNQMDDFLVQLLSKSDELGNLPQHALEAIAKRLEPVIIEAGQVVCRAGEVPQGLFLIELGSVELRPEASVKGEPPETLSSGSILGAAPLLTNKAYAYSVTAVGPGRMWRLSADDFQAISSRNPGLRRSLGRSVRSQLGRADQAQAASRLAGMPLFEQLPQPIIEAIVQRMVLQHAPAGERIFRIGDSGDAIYFIENGEVELTAENRSGVVEELARVGDEGFFGEQSLITGQIRTEDASATRNTNLWALY
jgi:CRP-like cAMP-binding protein